MHLAFAVSCPAGALGRMRGLLGTASLAPGAGLLLVPCRSVHTCFMRYAIDVVFLDRQWRVRKVVHTFPPWRLTSDRGSYAVLELPAGTLASSGTQVGDQLSFTPVVPE